MRGLLIAAASLGFAAPVAAEPAMRIASPAEALVQDAREYAKRYGLPLGEAVQRLRAQEESVPATDRIRDIYRDRLAGISIEHLPELRILVLLTGSDPVPGETISAGGLTVPIVFRTGAAGTQAEIALAIATHQAAIKAVLPGAQGMGVDTRTGELVLLVSPRQAARRDTEALDREVEAITGVPVRIRVLDQRSVDLGLEGGARVVGTDPLDGRRYVCTTGFVVTDGARTGVVTAAHCPDALSYRDPTRGEIPLEFVGQWGARYQDVQVHVGDIAPRPLFHADRTGGAARPLTTWRNRASMRVGDTVCRRGETSGYSCSEVELVDFAPPGDLCAGPCDPVWVSVAGPTCRGGDSGGPVFLGSTALGITKGGSYTSGRCNFYYYMSTDFLPEGWSLLTSASAAGSDRSGGLRP
jgi:hypothetical protein